MSRETADIAGFSEAMNAPLSDLLAMLRTMRPHGTRTERLFVEEWLIPLPGSTRDEYGNVFVEVGESEVLWSSHTDTVHHFGGPQRIAVTGDLIRLARSEKRASCLGADCTAGVWLMREMILARVPGLYVFHRAEEIGGLGSMHIACHTSHKLVDVKYAIAFDRKGRDSVITHQIGGRCCSTSFAVSLAGLLGPAYCLDSGGTFTDTANYMDIVPECTNISVGYEHQHTKRETQSISHAMTLRSALLRFDESALVCERDPTVREDDYWDLPPWQRETPEIDFMSPEFLDGPFTRPSYDEGDGWDFFDYDPKKKVKW